MADTITEVEAETLYEILVEAVDDTLAKDWGQRPLVT